MRRYRVRALNDIEASLRAMEVAYTRLTPERVEVEAINDDAAAELLAQLVGRGVRIVEMTALGGGLEERSWRWTKVVRHERLDTQRDQATHTRQTMVDSAWDLDSRSRRSYVYGEAGFAFGSEIGAELRSGCG